MAGKIFISYRRDDDPSSAARLRDGLAPRFGKANLFIDVDDLLAGQRFDEELAKALAVCDVLVAVIGQRWMELLKLKIASGERDHVREEIAAALQRRIVVIPVRVGREGQLPPLPRSGDLPADIRDLVAHQKHDVTHERFGRDIAELIEAISIVRRLNRPKSGVRQLHWGWAMVASLLAITYLGAHYAGVAVPWPAPSDTQIAMAEKSKDELERKRAEAEAKRRADEEPARVALAEKNRAEQAAKVEADRKQAEAEAQRRAEEEARRRDPALSIVTGSGQSFRDRLANGQPCPMCPEMVVVPAGSFILGSPANEPERSNDEAQVGVTIARPFAVGKFAVTFAEWDACVADGGCEGYRPDDHGWGRNSRPVINVSWDDTKLYIDWLNAKTGKTYRLLSEAEREYVTRAGRTTPFWWGSSITSKQANYNGNYTFDDGAKGEYRQQTVPVDSFEANPWGLFNVHGNVSEWTEDCWNDSNQGNPGNGSARTIRYCYKRVNRGGSWFNIPRFLRAAHRSMDAPDVRSSNLGFRLARTLNP
jgi:formylglycine-generating enzyme required for sulfatase activity